jgi:hypothetical protein
VVVKGTTFRFRRWGQVVWDCCNIAADVMLRAMEKENLAKTDLGVMLRKELVHADQFLWKE